MTLETQEVNMYLLNASMLVSQMSWAEMMTLRNYNNDD